MASRIVPTHPLFRAVTAYAFSADEANALASVRGRPIPTADQQKALNAAAFAGWPSAMRQMMEAQQRKLRLSPFTPRLNANWALAWAARGGADASMREAKKQGAYDVDRALANAAYGGHLGAMRLAKDWGAKNVDLALAEAAEAGEVEAMRLAKGWGATKFVEAWDGARKEARALLTAWRAEHQTR